MDSGNTKLRFGSINALHEGEYQRVYRPYPLEIYIFAGTRYVFSHSLFYTGRADADLYILSSLIGIWPHFWSHYWICSDVTSGGKTRRADLEEFLPPDSRGSLWILDSDPGSNGYTGDILICLFVRCHCY